MDTAVLTLSVESGLGALGSCLPGLIACTAAPPSAAVLLGLALATTGLCYLALWALGLVTPPPYCGAILLLISAVGAAVSLPWFATTATVGAMTLALVAAPLLLLVGVLMLLGQETS
jgi:hypothetical protein